MKLKFSSLTICAAVSMTSVIAWTGCVGGKHVAHNLPPAQRLMEPGPGVGGPGPGVIQPAAAMMGGPGGGAMMGPMMGGPMVGQGGEAACYGAASCGPLGGGGGAMGPVMPMITSQIAFLGVEGGEVAWDVNGQGMFDSTPLVMPGRQNFSQAAIYRLKLTNLPDREGVELYPTLEVAPVTPRTDAYLAHSPIPIQFTDEDLDQVLSGNYVTKVIYLPDPEFQELALAGVETLVSTRLDPGVDPIVEADRRGSILAILRMGNLDLQLPGQMIARADPGVRRAQYMAGSGSRGAFSQQSLEPTPESCEDGNSMDGGYSDGGYTDGGYSDGGYSDGGYGGENYESSAPRAGNYSAMSGAPMGMPAAGFAPQAVPPGVMSGVGGPQWGMPITGTPIGLPGPPHIPLGSPAGLTKHVMKNRTRVLMPPPVHKMKISVKQRPGMSYPRPVNHVKIDETNRAGFRLFGGTVTPALSALGQKIGAHFKKDRSCSECQNGTCEVHP